MEKIDTSGGCPPKSTENDMNLALAHALDETKRLQAELDQMKERLEARRVIDKAKCLLIEEGASEEEAFARMRKASMNARKPLKEVAEAIILSSQVR